MTEPAPPGLLRARINITGTHPDQPAADLDLTASPTLIAAMLRGVADDLAPRRPSGNLRGHETTTHPAHDTARGGIRRSDD